MCIRDRCAINALRSLGVHTDYIKRGGERLGIYYCEHGASQRPSKIIYDRARSSISQVEPGEFDWEKIFEGADWFHFTGITPALGPNVAEVTCEAVKAAKSMGCLLYTSYPTHLVRQVPILACLLVAVASSPIFNVPYDAHDRTAVCSAHFPTLPVFQIPAHLPVHLFQILSLPQGRDVYKRQSYAFFMLLIVKGEPCFPDSVQMLP